MYQKCKTELLHFSFLVFALNKTDILHRTGGLLSDHKFSEVGLQ